jgi:hypothetical protein
MGDFWHPLRRSCESLDPRAALVTPVSDRLFDIDAVYEDRIDISFRDSDGERSLRRGQFEVLVGQLERGQLSLDTLPPGVEPYAAVLSLSPEYVVDEGAFSPAPDDTTGGENPYLVSPEQARSRPERVHDDAVLLADVIDRVDTGDLTSLDTETLTDLYVLLSDVQRGANRFRRAVSQPLLDRLGPDQQLHGRFGTVRRTTRNRRHAKDDEIVLDALDQYGIPHEWVLGVDPDKLDVVLATTDLTEDEVYDVEDQVYVQKTGVDEGEKFSRLQGLADRLDDVEGGEQLQQDLAALEERIDEALSAG